MAEPKKFHDLSARAFRLLLIGASFFILLFTLNFFNIFSLYAVNPRLFSFLPRQTIKKTAVNAYVYPKIDTHEHYMAGGNIENYIAVMDKLGIKKAIFVPTGLAPDNKGYKKNMEELLKIAKKYPDKIIAYATIDEAASDSAEILEKAVQKGAKGLKLIGGMSTYYDEPLDSKKMYSVYRKAQELKIPILIHADPVAKPILISQLEKVFKDFPKTTFILAHYCRALPRGKPITNLELCSNLLTKHPNLVVDLSLGSGFTYVSDLANSDSRPIKNFILKFQDRLLWGADLVIAKNTKGVSPSQTYIERRIKLDADFLEKRSYASYLIKQGLPQWGLYLPSSVLEKIYIENPAKILGEKVLGKI